MTIGFFASAKALEDEMIIRRRDFHQHPELAFEEVRTAGIVAQELQALGFEVQTGVGKTGVVAILEGEHDGPTLLVRADMDALPIHETNQTDYVSTVPGKMHACGHDGHTAIGLAVAKMLTEKRQSIHGRIKFVFQPAEEIGQGARAMVEDGVLDLPRPDASIGLHLWNDLPYGTVIATNGPSMASADIWECKVTGYGGHGAQPHQTKDPVLAAAQIITAIQSIVSRNVSPLETAVVTVGTIHGGDAFNIIPTEVTIKGTIRTFKKETKALVHQRLHAICTGVAASLGCEAALEIQEMTLAVDNDEALADRVAAIAQNMPNVTDIRRDLRTMGSEDMSYLMDDIPGCYFFVGSADADRDLDYPHHNPRFDFDERALTMGAALLAELAATFVIPE